MAYDDGYYYGQCKLVAVVDNTADNGKTVLITTDDNKTYSGTIANKKCEFLLPPRTLYTVQKVSSGSAEFTTKVEAGYGDCILVHLDTGYVEVKQGDIVGLDYIKAATDANLKNKVPEAKAVKELNNSLNVRYNEDTDIIQIYFGGEWLDWKSADIQGYALLRDGVISESGYVSYPESKAFAKFENGVIKLGSTSKTNCYLAFALKEQINLSQYTKLIINVSTYSKPIAVHYAESLPTSYNWSSTELGNITRNGTIEFDLTNINSLAYIGFASRNIDVGETWIDSIMLK